MMNSASSVFPPSRYDPDRSFSRTADAWRYRTHRAAGGHHNRVTLSMSRSLMISSRRLPRNRIQPVSARRTQDARFDVMARAIATRRAAPDSSDGLRSTYCARPTKPSTLHTTPDVVQRKSAPRTACTRVSPTSAIEERALWKPCRDRRDLHQLFLVIWSALPVAQIIRVRFQGPESVSA